jgi:hypothetical protein
MANTGSSNSLSDEWTQASVRDIIKIENEISRPKFIEGIGSEHDESLDVQDNLFELFYAHHNIHEPSHFEDSPIKLHVDHSEAKKKDLSNVELKVDNLEHHSPLVVPDAKETEKSTLNEHYLCKADCMEELEDELKVELVRNRFFFAVCI